jgi:hypothetical protein
MVVPSLTTLCVPPQKPLHRPLISQNAPLFLPPSWAPFNPIPGQSPSMKPQHTFLQLLSCDSTSVFLSLLPAACKELVPYTPLAHDTRRLPRLVLSLEKQENKFSYSTEQPAHVYQIPLRRITPLFYPKSPYCWQTLIPDKGKYFLRSSLKGTY